MVGKYGTQPYVNKDIDQIMWEEEMDKKKNEMQKLHKRACSDDINLVDDQEYIREDSDPEDYL